MRAFFFGWVIKSASLLLPAEPPCPYQSRTEQPDGRRNRHRINHHIVQTDIRYADLQRLRLHQVVAIKRNKVHARNVTKSITRIGHVEVYPLSSTGRPRTCINFCSIAPVPALAVRSGISTAKVVFENPARRVREKMAG